MDTPETHLPSPSRILREAITAEGTRSQPHINQVIANRYEILKKLGEGGMGEVWCVYDLKLRVDIALKSIRRTDAVETLRQEVRTAREVISPNVCRIFDLVIEDNREFISMEYIHGQTLIALLKEKGPLNLPEAREIASQFLAGLAAIHQAGLVHRDLKPENIMITQTGRVVVMDFGIAKPAAQMTATISGTVPYMAPEQLSGHKIDPRWDVFAAGVILAEMIHPVRDFESRQLLWNAIREEPPRIRDSPWQRVIARAVAKDSNDRFPSAGALSRALEEVTQRADTSEEKKPYPGLSSFTEADAKFFFGRELEAETLLNKIQELHLSAIIGPSGAGKTSFLRAGLIPVLPANWSYIFIQPGDSPLSNLGQALAVEFSGDTEAIRKMVKLEDINDALWLLHRWRKKHPDVLLIIDRFEELFTLNDQDTQTRFAELIGRAVLEADVRILLAMRDDFLIFCNEHPFLSPIFSELTALSPLTGAPLRRALIQPALQCGYRFEDNALIDEILKDLEKERGALPLMAFAAARMWEKRDRTNGLLTRNAYEVIGGVAGALAQHAESTMERIGTERQGIVREIFRNLVTSQNTRAARDVEELLSIFENRNAAEEILGILIDARLLTSFEASTDQKEHRRRVEIIHESLLTAWPRLVRWQTQDADSAQFRDQLRQASQVWNDRGKPSDLLWTGTAYKEFEVWREKYSGGLTITEKAFSDAMQEHAKRQRRRRRVLRSTTFVVLLLIIAVIIGFWSSEKRARQEAVTQAQRAEASKLLALGRMEVDQDHTVALAYAIASLETADTPVARRFAVEALWKGPPAFIMSDLPIFPVACEFSPDGKWLAVGGFTGSCLLAQDGSESIQLTSGYPKTGRPHLQLFSPKGDFLVWSSSHDPNLIQVWSVAQRKVTRTFTMEGYTNLMRRGSQLIMITDLTGKTASTPQWKKCRIRTWFFNDDEPRIIGDWNWKEIIDLNKNNTPEQLAFPIRHNFDISNDAKFLAYGRDRSIYIRQIEPSVGTSEKLIGMHEHELIAVLFHPDGKHIASADNSGEIRIWSLSEVSKNPIRTIGSKGSVWNLSFNKSGSFFSAGYTDGTICLWDLNGPKDAEPQIFRRGGTGSTFIAFDPLDRRVAIPYNNSIAIWPIKRSYPYTINEKGDVGGIGGITQDGKWLVEVLGSDNPMIRLRNMNNFQADVRDLKMPVAWFNRFGMDQMSKDIGIAAQSGAYVISIDDGKTRRVPGAGAGFITFSPDGRLVATESYSQIPLWDTVSNKIRILTKNKNVGGITSIQFSSDGTLFSGHEDGSVYQWDVKKETNRLVAKGNKPAWVKVPSKNPNIVICLWMNQVSDIQKVTSELTVIDIKTRKTYPITTHGSRVDTFDFDPSGTILATGDFDGIMRIGPITGEEPHLLFGHKTINSIAIHPDGQWIATSEGNRAIIRLWRKPEGKPLHTLPYQDLMKKLRSLTNVRIVADQKSATGYRIQFNRFPGWQSTVNW